MNQLLILLLSVSLLHAATPLQSPKAIGEPVPIPTPIFDLAKTIAAATNGQLIQLPAGTFRVICNGIANRFDKSGITIRGMGYQRTTIVRDPNPAYAVNNQPVLFGVGDDITIEDLTLDCGGKTGDQYVHAGLRIDGANPSVRRVRVLSPSGNWNAGFECFTVFLNTTGVGIVEQCTIGQVQGDYVEGFSVGANCGLVKLRDCHVEFPVLPNNAHPPFLCGYQGGGMTMDNCTQVGGSGFFYAEDSVTVPRISNCAARNVQQGIVLTRSANAVIDGLQVDGCVIELSPAADAAQGANGIVVSGPGTKRNCRFWDNMIRFTGGAAPANATGIASIEVSGGSCNGTVIMGNSYDAAMATPQAPSDTSASIHANSVCARAVPVPTP